MAEYGIEGMKCRACVGKITDALLEAGYKDVFVTLDPPSLRLEAGPSVTRDTLQEKLAKVGDYRLTTTGASHAAHASKDDERLTPLFVVMAYIVSGTLLRAFISDDFSLEALMNNFMGGFLVVFSLFKLLNLKGFAEAYATYDIIAARSRIYALAYPFIELLLGVLYFLGAYPVLTNAITVALMSIGSVGVVTALRSNRKFQCACLGTALKLPMTKVTLVEDVGMGLMALLMLLLHLT